MRFLCGSGLLVSNIMFIPRPVTLVMTLAHSPNQLLSVSIALSFNVTLNAVTHEVSLLSQCNIWNEMSGVYDLPASAVPSVLAGLPPESTPALNLPLRLLT